MYTLEQKQFDLLDRSILWMPSEEEELAEKIFCYNKIIKYCEENNIELYTPEDASNDNFKRYYIFSGRENRLNSEGWTYNLGPKSENIKDVIENGEQLFVFKTKEGAEKVIKDCEKLILTIYG